VTTGSDVAPFSERDVNEATNRLGRLALAWRLRLDGIRQPELDRTDGQAYTQREMRFCPAGLYAEAVGRWPSRSCDGEG
jgi:hypothetical protein